MLENGGKKFGRIKMKLDLNELFGTFNYEDFLGLKVQAVIPVNTERARDTNSRRMDERGSHRRSEDT